MKRRELLSVLAALPALSACAPMSRGGENEPARVVTAIGIQLYTLRAAMAQDALGTLTALAAMGYQKVEFAGLHSHSATAVKGWLDRLQLTSPSSHADLQLMVQEPQQVLADAKMLGNSHLVIPWLPPHWRTPAAYPELQQRLRQWSAMASDSGLQLAYHNHDFEFERHGEWRLFDALLSDFSPQQLEIELDLFWITKAGADTAEYLQKHGQRITLCHVKDMGTDGAMVDVGQGTIDFAAHFAQLANYHPGVLKHHYVEHDQPADALNTAQTSIKHLGSLTY